MNNFCNGTEACKILNCSDRTLIRYRNQGKLIEGIHWGSNPSGRVLYNSELLAIESFAIRCYCYLSRSMKVFFTGTENLHHLNSEIIYRINNVCNLSADILIGNYRGFDRLALEYLRSIEYPNVIVYETGSRLSFGYQIINVGRYPAQDIEMSRQADFMLAIHSRGCRGVEANIRRMPTSKVRIIFV